MSNLKNKTIFITGASRGIGREIALRCAKDGANLVITGKSDTEGKLPGTIFSVAEEVEKAGGKALAMRMDVREAENVASCMEQAGKHFGGIDVLINNAGAIQLQPLEEVPPKRMDLMLDINVRGVLVCSHYAIPHLKKAGGAHILNLSPPLSLDPKWYGNQTVYTISKYGMSHATVGLSGELKQYKIAVNSLWPQTLIATAAVNMLMGDSGLQHSRTPAIMADAAYAILTSDPTQLTGQLLIDEAFLKSKGVKDFAKYSCIPGGELWPDLYIES